MGSFHGRRKPAAKKAPKQQQESAEDIAARQAKEQFIKDMAAKAAAALPQADDETGGIHPSRLARTAPGAAQHQSFSNRQGPPSRGQRAPDLRQKSNNNNKRTFDDANDTSVNGGPPKKQRTLQEIRKLKGPAAMQKEEEKRRKQALKEQEEAAARRAAQEKKESGPRSDDEDAQIPSKTGKKGIKTDAESAKTAEEKAARKAAKAAKKAARRDNALPTPEAGPETVSTREEEDDTIESKEARKARRKAEKAQKKNQDESVAPALATAEHSAPQPDGETKAEKKERKRLAKLAKIANAEAEPASGQESKKRKMSKKSSAQDVPADLVSTPSTTAVPAFHATSEATEKASGSKASESKAPASKAPESKAPKISQTMTTGSTNWSTAAAALGSKSSKFLKLMGGAKAGSQALAAPNQSDDASRQNDKVAAARRAERVLEKQFTAGQEAKQAGRKRGGLGA